mmetsp:Transcript_1932/g.3424  ORF Transcript_1932/g.3424 Transcript_1932/m.3424 type:complete len:83 (-) Transcript_1932:275-523(-)
MPHSARATCGLFPGGVILFRTALRGERQPQVSCIFSRVFSCSKICERRLFATVYVGTTANWFCKGFHGVFLDCKVDMVEKVC